MASKPIQNTRKATPMASKNTPGSNASRSHLILIFAILNLSPRTQRNLESSSPWWKSHGPLGPLPSVQHHAVQLNRQSQPRHHGKPDHEGDGAMFNQLVENGMDDQQADEVVRPALQ